jgi:hypothetical protein
MYAIRRILYIEVFRAVLSVSPPVSLRIYPGYYAFIIRFIALKLYVCIIFRFLGDRLMHYAIVMWRHDDKGKVVCVVK